MIFWRTSRPLVTPPRRRVLFGLASGRQVAPLHAAGLTLHIAPHRTPFRDSIRLCAGFGVSLGNVGFPCSRWGQRLTACRWHSRCGVGLLAAALRSRALRSAPFCFDRALALQPPPCIQWASHDTHPQVPPSHSSHIDRCFHASPTRVI